MAIDNLGPFQFQPDRLLANRSQFIWHMSNLLFAARSAIISVHCQYSQPYVYYLMVADRLFLPHFPLTDGLSHEDKSLIDMWRYTFYIQNVDDLQLS